MSNEIQKDDFILKGDLGNVNGREITHISFNRKRGATTITVAPISQKTLDLINRIEDADFEVIQPKQIEQ